MNGLTQNISLCGIKHAGKSAAGRALSRLLDLPFCDTDTALEEFFARKTGLASPRSVRSIYRELGEDAFRQLEAETVRSIASSAEKKVIALGGGVLSNPYMTADDIVLLGCICYLDVPDIVAFKRIIRKGLPPFLFNEKDPFRVFCESNVKRREIFARYARITIRTGGPDDTAAANAEKILDSYRELYHE